MQGNLGNMRCFRRSQRLALYQGTTSSRAVKAQTELGFSPCAFSLQIRVLVGLTLGGIDQFRQVSPQQGLKPDVFSSFTARLKSCPDTKQKTQNQRGLLLQISFASTQKM